MAPSLEDWRRAITPATRAVLVAHLFGCRTKMEPLLDLARQHHLMVIEDCAQAFAGTGYQGHPQADASMFSFGTIKISTALGGAILRIRDRELLARMRAAQAAYPTQGPWSYLKRLAKYAALKALTCRPIGAMFAHTCRAIGCDYDRWVNHAARGFPGDDFFTQIRRQASASLLALLERRLQRYDCQRWEQHTAKGKALAALLQEGVSCPGATAVPHTYWVFPILVEEPDRLMDGLARAGFDATQGHSLCVVAPPRDRPGQGAAAAETILTKVVFLPFYPELPGCESQRMAQTVLKVAGQQAAEVEKRRLIPRRSSFPSCPTP
jgi:dTDP-4-amino-4,6-dideoxygalactose transaminase